LPPLTAYRRTELQDPYHKLHAEIDELDQRVGDQAFQRPGAKLLMSHPGVGPVTALATAVFLGDPMRFADGKAVVSYVGMIPSECSSGGQQRLGGLSKQGNRNMIHIRIPGLPAMATRAFPRPFCICRAKNASYHQLNRTTALV
jgi:transposase